MPNCTKVWFEKTLKASQSSAGPFAFGAALFLISHGPKSHLFGPAKQADFHLYRQFLEMRLEMGLSYLHL